MRVRVTGLLLLVVMLGGCTARYSQVLVGSIRRLETTPVKQSDSGFEMGLGTPSALIAFSEPTSARDLSAPACEVELTEVDYRGTWFSLYYLAFNFPKVKTTSYCVVAPR
jgi:hypothetical protein